MPAGTKVDGVYKALRKDRYSEAAAARVAPSETGEALATGKPPRHVAASNASEDAQMIQPSSTRVTPSPGNKILRDLRLANEAAAQPAMTPEKPAKKPRAPRKPKAAAPAPDTGAAKSKLPDDDLIIEPDPVTASLMKLGHSMHAATQIAKTRAGKRETIDEPTSLERRDWIERMNKQVGEARARQAAAPKPQTSTQPSEDAVPFEPSKFIASHPVYKERIAAGDTPEKAGHAANQATFADHPVYQENIARGASPKKAATAAEADMVATARARSWNEKHRAGRAEEDARMVRPSSTRTTSSEPEAPTLRAVTESPEPDMLEESEAAAERGRSRNLPPPGKRTY